MVNDQRIDAEDWLDSNGIRAKSNTTTQNKNTNTTSNNSSNKTKEE